MITYQTTLSNHFKCLKQVIIFTTAVSLFFYLFTLFNGEKIEIEELIIGLLLFIFFNLPTIYLHLSYYLENASLKIEIDTENEKINIIQSNKKLAYSFSNIILAERHLGIYYKNKIDRAGRRIAPWTPYGYILLKFDDDKTVYITALMMDIIDPPINVQETHYRFIPYFKR